MGIVNPYENKEKFSEYTYQAREKATFDKLGSEEQQAKDKVAELQRRQFYKEIQEVLFSVASCLLLSLLAVVCGICVKRYRDRDEETMPLVTNNGKQVNDYFTSLSLRKRSRAEKARYEHSNMT